MKYIGVSTPAWSMLSKGKEAPMSDAPRGNMYLWEEAFNKQMPSPRGTVINAHDRKTLEHFAKPEEDDAPPKLAAKVKSKSVEVGRTTAPLKPRKKVMFPDPRNLSVPKIKGARPRRINSNEEYILKNNEEHPSTSESSQKIVTPKDKREKVGFFNRTKRFVNDPSSITERIGPGTYNPKTFPAAEVNMSYKYEHEALIQAKQGVGPAHYFPDYKFIDSEKSVTIKKNKAEQHPLQQVLHSNLGPGQYEILRPENDASYRSVKGSFSTAAKSQSVPSTTGNKIGPLTYNTNLNTIAQFAKNSLNKFSIGSRPRKRSLTADMGPGPAKYNTRSEEIKTRGGVLAKSKRRALAEESKVPGPSAYPLKSFTEQLIHRNETIEAKRLVLLQAKNKTVKPSSTFGKGSRSKMTREEASPGPGLYSPDKIQTKIEISMAQKPKQVKLADENPGPGHYESEKQSFFYKMGTHNGPSYREPHQEILGSREHKVTPGPLDYNLNYSQVEPSETSYKIAFPREARIFRWQQGDPEIDTGPGIYDIKSTIPQLPPFETPEYRERGIHGLFG